MKRQSVRGSEDVPDQAGGFSSGLAGDTVTSISTSEESLNEPVTEISPGGHRDRFQNPWSYVLLEPSIVRDAGQLLGRGHVLQRHAKFRLSNAFAHHELIRKSLTDNGSALDCSGPDARIVYMKRLAVT